MIRISKYLRLWLPGFLLVVLPVVYAMGQTDIYFTGQTVEWKVDPAPGTSYYWSIYCDPNVNFATTPGNCTGNEAEFVGGIQNQPTVNVKWNKPGIYFFRVFAQDNKGCTNLKVGMVEVKALPTAQLKLNPEEVCVSEPSFLTVTLTGQPVWSFILQARDADGNTTTATYTNIDSSKNPYEITVTPSKTTWYTVTEVTDRNGVQHEPSNSVKLTVNPLPKSSRIYLKTE